MWEKSSYKRRQKDCSSRPSGSPSGRTRNSAEGRTASIRSLIDEIEVSFTATRGRVEAEGTPATSEEEKIEILTGEAVRQSRREADDSPKQKASRR